MVILIFNMKELMPCFRDNFLPPSNEAGNEDQEMEGRGEKEKLTNIQRLPSSVSYFVAYFLLKFPQMPNLHTFKHKLKLSSILVCELAETKEGNKAS